MESGNFSINPSRNRITACSSCSNLRGFSQFNESSGDRCDRCDYMEEIIQRCSASGLRLTRDDRLARRWSGFQWILRMADTQVELFTLAGLPKPFSDFPVKKICENTASANSLLKVQEWLAMCRNSHTSCQSQSLGPTVLPRRVLDVNVSPVRLYQTHYEPGQYACLSHCWGDTRPLCRTTPETLEANQNGIEWHSLPATFQDAIDFTRRLGLHYLWIDSICIIQDDGIDWSEQSALMATIYENAYITLCATASSSDDGGCYSGTPLQWKAREFSVRKPDDTEYQIYIRPLPNERHIPDWDRAPSGGGYGSFPLMTRAWTYQERLLSPRLVHFTAGEIMWECSEVSDCECYQGHIGGRFERHAPFFRFNSQKKVHRRAIYGSQLSAIHRQWDDTVFAFSSLGLTFAKDKLPALSGVAKQTLECRPGDEYLAGLWRKTIISDLRWILYLHRGTRPVWRSPSWSWASLDGLIRHLYYGTNARDYCSCVDASVTPSGLDPTGEVSSGYLVLSAPVILGRVQEASSWNGVWNKCFLKAAGLEVQFHPDCMTDFEDGLLVIGDNLLCLRLGNCQGDEDMCLVLKRRGGTESLPIYNRVGYFCHKIEQLEEHWFMPGLRNTLVKIT